MFLRKQSELKQILFDHFNGLEASDFDLKYCKEYPKASNANKLLKGGGETLANFVDITTNNDKVRRKEKEMAELREGGATAALIRFRDQLRVGFKLVANEVYQQQRGKKKKLGGTAQMEHCVKLLVENDIDKIVIQSVLRFAYDSELFGKKEAETDAEDEVDDGMMEDVEILPSWFHGYGFHEESGDEEGQSRKKWELPGPRKTYNRSSLMPKEEYPPMDDVEIMPSFFLTNSGIQHIVADDDSDD